MVQTRHNVRSTNPKPAPTTQRSSKLQARPISPLALPAEITNELHSWDTPISKIYSNYTGRFPVRARSGNQYVVILFHCDRITILQAPFKTKANNHCLAAYNSIWGLLKYLGHKVDLQILDNKASTEYKRFIAKNWGSRYQLVPPNIHRCNAAKRAICKFKAHFLATLAGTCAKSPNFLWDQHLEQDELNLNMMRQTTADPIKPAWDYLHGRPFNYDARPLGPLVIPVIMHNKPIRRKS